MHVSDQSPEELALAVSEPFYAQSIGPPRIERIECIVDETFQVVCAVFKVWFLLFMICCMKHNLHFRDQFEASVERAHACTAETSACRDVQACCAKPSLSRSRSRGIYFSNVSHRVSETHARLGY